MTATTDAIQLQVGERLMDAVVLRSFNDHETGFGFRRFVEVELVDDRPLCQLCKQRRGDHCVKYGTWPDPKVRYCVNPMCGAGGVRCNVPRGELIGLDS